MPGIKKPKKYSIWYLDTYKEQNWEEYKKKREIEALDEEMPFGRKIKVWRRYKRHIWHGYLKKYGIPLNEWDEYLFNKREDWYYANADRNRKICKKAKFVKRYGNIVAG